MSLFIVWMRCAYRRVLLDGGFMGVKKLDFEKLDESKEFNEIVRKAVDTAFNSVAHENLAMSGIKLEQVESRSRDGFISSNDGGWEKRGFMELGALVGSGWQAMFNEEIQKKIDELHDADIGLAKEEFIRLNKDLLQSLNISPQQVNYHSLNELKQTKLAEKLSSMERDFSEGEQSALMFQIEAFIPSRSRTEKEATIYVAVALNWEAPYHRKGSNNEIYVSEEVTFSSAEDLKKKLLPAIKGLARKIVIGVQ